jgi:glycosyltransferase involved in cell wall biosynthesis
MDILQIAPWFPPLPENAGSGVVRVVYNVSKELAKRGHNVTLCAGSSATGTASGQLIRRADDPVIVDGVRVLYFPYVLSYDLFYLTPQMIPYIKKNIEAFDIAHLHDVRCFQSIVAHRYAKKNGVPYVVQLHGSYLAPFGGNKLKWLLDNAASTRTLKDASRVIALTTTEAAYLKQNGVGDEKIDLVGNGIDFSEDTQPLIRGRFRQKFGISNEELVVLYVGRITSSKGLDLLVDAFSDLTSHLDAVKLVLVGGDHHGYKSTLKKRMRDLRIEDCCVFTGPVDESDKTDAYVDADVFVTPRFTGFPLTFLESCACGTPIVTTRGGDSIDWIDGFVGYVTDDSKKALAAAITTILCDDQIRERFKENCRTLAQRFSWPSVVDEIEKTYRRAAGT